MNPAQPSKTVPILAGGLFLGALSAIPPISFLNCACCILVIGGGFLASYLYMKDYPSDQPRVTYGDGALLGLLAGLFGAVVDTVISIQSSSCSEASGTRKPWTGCAIHRISRPSSSSFWKP